MVVKQIKPEKSMPNPRLPVCATVAGVAKYANDRMPAFGEPEPVPPGENERT